MPVASVNANPVTTIDTVAGVVVTFTIASPTSGAPTLTKVNAHPTGAPFACMPPSKLNVVVYRIKRIE